jgi:hypothetical protein
MSRKCPVLSARNERETRERRNRDAGQSREKAEIEQRKNKERTKKSGRIQRLKKGNLFALDFLISISSFQMF